MTNTSNPEVTSQTDGRQLQRAISRFQLPSRLASCWQLVNTLVPYAVLWGLAWYLLQYSFWASLPAIILAAGFLLRTFIIFHDCGHQSFFKSKRANNFWGRLTGLLTLTPYYYWHANHARHHATSANLDKRGHGDVWMMTVDEYRKAPFVERLKYRLYRNPFIMLFLGPLFIAFVSHRLVRSGARDKERRSVHLTNAAILGMIAGMGLLVGFAEFFIIQGLICFIAFVSGVWLFYVQHQFEGVYWARDGHWDFVTASIEGGSFYKLPGILRWFSGNIGYHHVHHLNPRVPNYRLPEVHESFPALNRAPTINFLSSFKALGYRLWDEKTGKLVGFREARYRKSA